jgi:predicted membrane protein
MPSSHGPSGRHLALMGGLDRRGSFELAPSITSITLLGGVDLDLTEATWPASEVTVTKVSLLGGCKVVVPAGVAVEVRGFSLFGGHDVRVAPSPSAGRSLRVRAFGLLGGVRVVAA